MTTPVYLAEHRVLDISLPCTADLSSNIYAPLSWNGTTVGLAAAGASAVGFLQNKPNGSGAGDRTAGPTATNRVNGTTRCVASAAITAGDKIASAGAGQVRTAQSGDHVIGIALGAATGAGELIGAIVTLGGAPLP